MGCCGAKDKKATLEFQESGAPPQAKNSQASLEAPPRPNGPSLDLGVTKGTATAGANPWDAESNLAVAQSSSQQTARQQGLRTLPGRVIGQSPEEARAALEGAFTEQCSGVDYAPAEALGFVLAAHVGWLVWNSFEEQSGPFKSCLIDRLAMDMPQMSQVMNKVQGHLQTFVTAQAGSIATHVLAMFGSEAGLTAPQYQLLLDATPGMVHKHQESRGSTSIKIESADRVAALYELAHGTTKDTINCEELGRFISSAVRSASAIAQMVCDLVSSADFHRASQDSEGLFMLLFGAVACTLMEESEGDLIALDSLRKLTGDGVRHLGELAIPSAVCAAHRYALQSGRASARTDMRSSRLEAALYLDVLAQTSEDSVDDSVESAVFCSMLSDLQLLSGHQLFAAAALLEGGSSVIGSVQPQWAQFLQLIEAKVLSEDSRNELGDRYFQLAERYFQMTPHIFSQSVHPFDHRMPTDDRIDALFEVVYGGHEDIDVIEFKGDLCDALEIGMCALHQLTQAIQDTIQAGGLDDLIQVLLQQQLGDAGTSSNDIVDAYKLFKADLARVYNTMCK